ncbi:MupA/Atu3671 family FMN-dependent luciferase-like monooxygenase [Bacillus wiedmannii]|uniref:MupA/Atu3671 family FMN-dependent luciferase-like monooxygenase n=1 Tax=Bacillus wiedmannii TaxID=1890302 RepID=UPI000BF019A2|nr:MupA/Atu3671 family FMN-dependent luciferase-like monooxygenase [Bacillus wiedmannii]PEL51560.1 siderophore biosynthesis protein [Bacillus wiedmannii]PEO05787.1 siderophore biosynthesis protein [Bacillus wiedmannii]PEP99145.1 siderophore biosynthesis protein [Bacillus wiedmannii]
MDFSIFFFSSYQKKHTNKYEMLIEAVKFADQNNFTAIWTPERHFHEFGGLYPNPSVVSAGLAMVSDRIKIRSGSIVSPLHSPVRIAEDWSVVDNLSNGRVEIAFASGWHADDFVFFPDRYNSRTEIMYQQIEQVRALWKGQTLKLFNGSGKEIDVKTYPRPLQSNLKVWIASNGNEETIRTAAKIGANLLTNFIGQDLSELKQKIQLYRKTLEENGHSPINHKVSVMMHTFIGNDLDSVKSIVREPFTNYLSTSLELIKKLYENNSKLASIDLNNPKMLKRVSEIAFSRYWQTSALLGTVETCVPIVKQLKEIGVDEIACLIDFGIDDATVLEGLTKLVQLKNLF